MRILHALLGSTIFFSLASLKAVPYIRSIKNESAYPASVSWYTQYGKKDGETCLGPEEYKDHRSCDHGRIGEILYATMVITTHLGNFVWTFNIEEQAVLWYFHEDRVPPPSSPTYFELFSVDTGGTFYNHNIDIIITAPIAEEDELSEESEEDELSEYELAEETKTSFLIYERPEKVNIYMPHGNFELQPYVPNPIVANYLAFLDTRNDRKLATEPPKGDGYPFFTISREKKGRWVPAEKSLLSLIPNSLKSRAFAREERRRAIGYYDDTIFTRRQQNRCQRCLGENIYLAYSFMSKNTRA